MYISIGRRLRGLGNIRIGRSLRGSKAWIFISLYGFLNLMWFCILGSLWLVYGIGYLCFYLPIKGIIKLCKYIDKKKKIEEAASKYDRSPQE